MTPYDTLQAEAKTRGLPCLSDDEHVTLGLGKGSRTWPLADAPTARDVPWAELFAIPVGVVVGGEDAAGGLVVAMAREAKLVAERAADPAEARRLLRRRDLEAAVVQMAGEGLLREGLALAPAAVLLARGAGDRVAVAASHVVGSGGRVVVDAEDEALAAKIGGFAAPVALYAVSPGNGALGEHRACGGEIWTVMGGALVRATGSRERVVVRVDEVRHDPSAALAAAALAAAMGIPERAIAAGLRA
jgi:hypothetical protein